MEIQHSTENLVEMIPSFQMSMFKDQMSSTFFEFQCLKIDDKKRYEPTHMKFQILIGSIAEVVQKKTAV